MLKAIHEGMQYSCSLLPSSYRMKQLVVGGSAAFVGLGALNVFAMDKQNCSIVLGLTTLVAFLDLGSSELLQGYENSVKDWGKSIGKNEATLKDLIAAEKAASNKLISLAGKIDKFAKTARSSLESNQEMSHVLESLEEIQQDLSDVEVKNAQIELQATKELEQLRGKIRGLKERIKIQNTTIDQLNEQIEEFKKIVLSLDGKVKSQQTEIDQLSRKNK